MVEFLKTLAIACIPAIITGIVTYIVARKNAASQISIIKEQNKHDLEKLMELLQNRLAGDTVSLYDIYQYLKLHIASDQDEPEAVVPGEEDAEAVVCMTVHNSKGLEFDTVILPFTNQSFPTKERTEILVDEKE